MSWFWGGRRAPPAPQTNGNVTETPVGSAVHVNVYDLWESNDSVVRHPSPYKPFPTQAVTEPDTHSLLSQAQLHMW
jgi:hypothetical protein